MAHRPFKPAQQRQNAAFLAALRRTGNVRLACRELNLHRATYTKRRGKCAAFATEWDMALAAAHAAFQRAGGERLPEIRPGTGRGTARSAVEGPDAQRPEGLRTKGGEPVIVRQANGRLQLRRAPPGRMTEAGAAHVLATLSETANLRLAAASAGFAHTSLIVRCRLHPDFASETAICRRIGRDRVQWQWLERERTAREDGWRCDFDHPMPVMTAAAAMQQLRYHDKDGRFRYKLWCRRAPPRPLAELAPRILLKWQAMERARHLEATGSWRFPEEGEAPVVPVVDLETGLARGSGMAVRVTYDSDGALFGGWRIEDWEKRKKAG